MLVEHDQIRALTGGDRAGDLVEPVHLGDVDRVAGDRFLKTYSFVGQQWPGARIAGGPAGHRNLYPFRSEEHTSELQSLMRISYAVFCLKNKHQLHTLPNSTCH